MDYNLIYKEKYLKYKLKYLDLKKSIYGGIDDINNIKKDDLIHIWYKNWPDQGVPKIEDFYKFIIYCNEDIKNVKVVR